jgi:precorrin-6Y C5,15-methyltransferase (decarboxylating)
MQVTLAAFGGGNPNTLTEDCRQALENASWVIGASRLLEGLPENCTSCRVAATRPGEILQLIRSYGEDGVVLYSGDTGFYSGAKVLIPLLEQEGISYTVLPGISSVQLLSAALGRPWQDWLLFSAHGVDCNPVGAVMQGKPVFFLTGGTLGPAELCRLLAEAGLDQLPVVVGEDLSYPQQKIHQGTAGEFAGRTFGPLSVLLVEPAPAVTRRTPGFPDAMFVRGEVPMTKQEVRAAVLAKLAPGPKDVLWDVGAGTGSVSVELALQASWGRTYGVECDPQACDLIRRNREKLGAWNLKLVEGAAPQALQDLETPDGVFIGGTKGALDEIVELVLSRNPKARICISAICIETLYQAVQALQSRGVEPEVTQISVSRGRAAGFLHLLMANNPVFLIAGNCHD